MIDFSPLVTAAAQCGCDAIIVSAMKLEPAAVFVKELLNQHFDAEDWRHFDANLLAKAPEIDRLAMGCPSSTIKVSIRPA